jgi:hypothetical protein
MNANFNNDEALRRDPIARAIAEIDLQQLAISCAMTPAQRFQRACALIEEAEQAAVKRLREERPELSEIEALHIYRRGDSDN